MTILQERSRELQGTGGPRAWLLAWDRVRDLLGPVWPDSWWRDEPTVGTWVQEDGAAALATALYLAAAETGTDPAEVGADRVRALYIEASTGPAFLTSWEVRLRALGHDLDDGTFDPVAACWQKLKVFREPIDESGWRRSGHGLLEGLGFVLSDHMREVAARAADPATAAWWA